MSNSGVFSRVSRTRILFVDGDPDARFAYQASATAEGFAVELAADGREAIALANILLPDVIVADARLRGVDGLEVVRHLRSSARTGAIPIIVVSADSTESGDTAVRATGCDGHLVKPCSARALLQLARVLVIDRRERASFVRREAGVR